MEQSKAIIGLEAEQALLGSCLHSQKAFEDAQKIVTAEDFGEQLHAIIWSIMWDIRAEGANVTPITIVARATPETKAVKIADATFQQYIVSLYTNATSINDAHWFATEVKKSATRRRILGLSKDIYHRAMSDFSVLPVEIAKDAINEFDGVHQSVVINTNPVVDADKLIAQMLQEIEDRQAGKGSASVTTGLKALDTLIGGLNPSDLVILAGRPGMGKSALATSLMLSAAKAGAGCFFASLEMSSNQIAYRLASEHLYERRKASYSSMMNADVDPHLKQMLLAVHRNLCKLPFRIDPTPAITVPQLAIACRKYQAELIEQGKELRVVFVDYLQLMKPTTNYRGNKVAETTEISNGLKALAKELNVCVVALSQLSRAGEQGDDKRPQLHHLRDSGAIEQDANIVLFPYREEYYLQKSGQLVPFEKQNKIEIHVAKNRNGEEGKPVFNCDIAFNHFSDLE